MVSHLNNFILPCNITSVNQIHKSGACQMRVHAGTAGAPLTATQENPRFRSFSGSTGSFYTRGSKTRSGHGSVTSIRYLCGNAGQLIPVSVPIISWQWTHSEHDLETDGRHCENRNAGKNELYDQNHPYHCDFGCRDPRTAPWYCWICSRSLIRLWIIQAVQTAHRLNIWSFLQETHQKTEVPWGMENILFSRHKAWHLSLRWSKKCLQSRIILKINYPEKLRNLK